MAQLLVSGWGGKEMHPEADREFRDFDEHVFLGSNVNLKHGMVSERIPHARCVA
jgi:hypothetical protein